MRVVLDMLARFVANPDQLRRRDFYIDLLDREVARAQYNLLGSAPLIEVDEDYKFDIARAARALRIARRNRWLNSDCLDLPSHWLTLLGHRLAIENGLSVESMDALAEIAARRLSLSLATTDIWDVDTLFRRYTETDLRAEWDYPGLQFRYLGPRENWPPESARREEGRDR